MNADAQVTPRPDKQAMKTFIVFTDKYVPGPRSRVKTRRHEVVAIDAATACRMAEGRHPGSMTSMFWPKSK